MDETLTHDSMLDIDFVGRIRELGQLDVELERARRGRGSFAWLSGRRRVGKSRSVQEFIETRRVNSVFFQCPQRRDPLGLFVAALAASSLPAARLIAEGSSATTWQAALRLAAHGATPSHPIVIVLDEFPYLHHHDPGVDADIQAIWDHELEKLPVVLICIGSDLAMMERVLQHDRPLHGRPTAQLPISVLDPADVGGLLGLEPAAALDAYLVVGGFPSVALAWRPGRSMTSYLKSALATSATPLVINGERILNAELAGEFKARTVLEAIGTGERTFTTIGSAAGVGAATLERSLKALVDKGLVERRLPLAIPPGKSDARYSIADPGLRFWLRFVGPHLAELERGRSDIVVARVLEQWNEYRGVAIEGVVREALMRMLPAPSLGATRHVGGFWTRSNHVEIDLVGADRTPTPTQISFVGSIKWRQKGRFNQADAAALVRHRGALPGAPDTALLVGVSRTGFDTDLFDVQIGPQELLDAYGAALPEA